MKRKRGIQRDEAQRMAAAVRTRKRIAASMKLAWAKLTPEQYRERSDHMKLGKAVAKAARKTDADV